MPGILKKLDKKPTRHQLQHDTIRIKTIIEEAISQLQLNISQDGINGY